MISPGILLRRRCAELNLTQDELANHLGVGRCTVNELMNGKRSFTPEMSLRLARVFGSCPEFWLLDQMHIDITRARRRLKKELQRMRPLRLT